MQNNSNGERKKDREGEKRGERERERKKVINPNLLNFNRKHKAKENNLQTYLTLSGGTI